MSVLTGSPAHTHPLHQASISEESLDLQSTTEHHDSYPSDAPIPVFPSPYRATTAAAFMDINKALAARSLQDSVRRSSQSTGNLPTMRNTTSSGSPSRSPQSPLPARSVAPAVEPQRVPPDPKPKLVLTRSRSMTAHWKPWSPLRSKRSPTQMTGGGEKSVEVALNTEGGEPSGHGTRTSGDGRVEKEGAPHPDMPAQDARTPRKRRSTVHCIIM
ncbi:hypothetical protein FRC12_018211 [Ceratobasidium sp. 428]|nr:hypothetical protein FRC12_018211 [Ceratobasidium sp. 428]